MKLKPNVVKGFWLRWEDSQPFSSRKRLVGGKVGHKNPTFNMMANAIYAKSSDYLINNPWVFLVRCEVIFEKAKHGEKDKIDLIEIECKERYTINELNRVVRHEILDALKSNKRLEDGHKNKGIFKTVKFYVEILKA